MPLDAVALLRESTRRHGIHLSVLVADTGVWASPEVHRRLVAENGTGAFFAAIRRHREGDGEKRGEVREGVRLDDNTYAKHAIKQAVGVSRDGAPGFEACHVWPRSCYDARYHTAVANLVLLPRALAGLSDHDDEISAALQYRAYELYSWHPADAPPPERPSFYPEAWRPPEPFTAAVERALRGRKASHSRAAMSAPDV